MLIEHFIKLLMETPGPESVNNTTISTTGHVYFNDTQVLMLWLMYTELKQNIYQDKVLSKQ